MMISVKQCGLFLFSILLTGCAGYICPDPGEPKFNNHNACWYSMKVVDVDPNTNLVTATISADVGGKEVDHDKKYKFYVRDLPKGMTWESIKKKDYVVFVSEQRSSYLDLFLFPPEYGAMQK